MRDDTAIATAVELLVQHTSAPSASSRGEWTERALCAHMDPETFFPPKGDAGTQAKQTCARCPVRAACLDYAIATDEKHGIWGGLNRTERQRASKALEATDPAKAPLASPRAREDSA